MPEEVNAVDVAVTDALSRTCVVIPAHNEAAVIGDVLTGLESLACRVIVVDDGSLDDTYSVCLSRPVELLRHGVNLGQGAALQTGITYALSLAGVSYIVTFDADGQHGVDSIVSLIGSLTSGRHDVALGTRFARATDAREIPLGRRALLKCAIAFTRVTAGLAVTDTHNGLRAFTAEAASRLDIKHCGMAHASEILTTIRRERLRWCEVPVTISYSEYSTSKGQRGGAAMDIVWDLVMGRIR
jgi:glycosyltransferase involved in cell wall biosynthesis